MSTGLVFERMFEKALIENGYDVVTKNLNDPAELVRIANEVRPGRVKNVCEKIGRANLEKASCKYILDHVYGLDCVLAPAGLKSVERFAFDITCNPNAVADKLDRARSNFQDLWKAIGISKVAVILFTTQEEELGLGFIQLANLNALGDVIAETCIFAMDEDPDYIQSYTIDFDVAIKV